MRSGSAPASSGSCWSTTTPPVRLPTRVLAGSAGARSSGTLSHSPKWPEGLRRSRDPHVHQWHDRAAEGRDAHARQRLVERLQRRLSTRHPTRRHHPCSRTALPHRRAQQLRDEDAGPRRHGDRAPRLQPLRVRSRRHDLRRQQHLHGSRHAHRTVPARRLLRHRPLQPAQRGRRGCASAALADPAVRRPRLDPAAGVGPDGDRAVRDTSARRADAHQARLRGHPDAAHRGPGRRRRYRRRTPVRQLGRDRGPRAQRDSRLLAGPGRHGARVRRRGLVPLRGHRLPRRTRAASSSSTDSRT